MGKHRGGEASSHLTGETSPRAVQPHRGWRGATAAGAEGTLPRGWSGGTGLAEGLPAFTHSLWGLPAACRTPPLPPSSFPLFSICAAQTCKLLPCTRVSDFQACLFISQIQLFSFFVPWCGLSDRQQNGCSGRERGAEEPGTEHVSPGVGLGRAVRAFRCQADGRDGKKISVWRCSKVDVCSN